MPSGAESSEAPVAEQVAVPLVTGRLSVDGVLNETSWSGARRLSVPWEWAPTDGGDAPVATTVFLLRDQDYLYLGFEAADPNPADIRARYADRDLPLDDDGVGVLIDPFGDRRRAFQFRVNPLGVQMDAVTTDGGSGSRSDYTWDAIWEAGGQITSSGYVAEIAIPFRQLRFPRSSGLQNWGFLAFRSYPRSATHELRSIRTDLNRSCLVCQVPPIVGFAGLATGLNLEITPTLTAKQTTSKTAAGASPERERNQDLGLSARWGISPNVSLNLAVNPDFSQVEADALQLDANLRFAIALPEKRPFFLEGADLFETPNALVVSRTIAEPQYGAKVTGKEGDYAFGAFLTRDRITEILLPGAEGSALATAAGAATGIVLRARRDVGAGSSIGVLATSRTGLAYDNNLLAVDGVWRLGASDSLVWQFGGSRGQYPTELEATGADLDLEPTGHILALNYTHNDSNWYWNGRYKQISPGFRADSGFIPQVGIRSAQAGVERTWRPPKGSQRWYNRLGVYAGAEILQDWNSSWTEWGGDFVVSYRGPRQFELVLVLAPNQEYLAGETYRNLRYVIDGKVSLSQWARIGYRYNAGEALDFANFRSGDLQRITSLLELNIGRRIRLELTETTEKLSTTGNEIYRLHTSQGRLLYHLNRRAFGRLILQQRRLDRNPALYINPVTEREDRTTPQLLLSYKLNSQTAALIGYGAVERTTDELAASDVRTFFVKFSYAFLQ